MVLCPGFESPISADHLSIFDTLPNGQRLPKWLPYCPQTGLTMLIYICNCSSNKPHKFSTYSRENINIRGVTIKILKSTPNNRRGKSICASVSLLPPMVNDIEKKQKSFKMQRGRISMKYMRSVIHIKYCHYLIIEYKSCSI